MINCKLCYRRYTNTAVPKGWPRLFSPGGRRYLDGTRHRAYRAGDSDPGGHGGGVRTYPRLRRERRIPSGIRLHEEKVGRYAAEAAVRIAEALMNGRPYSLEEDIPADARAARTRTAGAEYLVHY